MPHKAVVDSTVLVSAFLTPKGVSDELLRQGRRGAFTLCLSDEIIEETRRVLMEYERIRKRYSYSDQDVEEFGNMLRGSARLARNVPPLHGITRDPKDDMVIACALAAKANYIVTRDPDLLTLEKHKGLSIVTPEMFMGILKEKSRPSKNPFPKGD